MQTLILDEQPDYFWSEVKANKIEDYFSMKLPPDQVEIVIIKTPTTVDQSFIARYPKLKMIIRSGSGYDNIDLKLTRKANIIVCNTPEANTIAAFEHTMAFIFAMIKQHQRSKKNVLQKKWKDELAWNYEINELTVLVVGLGRIGTKVAQALQLFGARVWAVDPYLSQKQWLEKKITRVSYDQGLKCANLISYHCPLTKETKNYFSDNTLNTLSHPAYLVNTARGPIVNEVSLKKGLNSGQIIAAGLDVYDSEPNPELTFGEYDNVYLTPHTGAYTQAAKIRLAKEVVTTWKSFVDGGEAISRVFSKND